MFSITVDFSKSKWITTFTKVTTL